MHGICWKLKFVIFLKILGWWKFLEFAANFWNFLNLYISWKFRNLLKISKNVPIQKPKNLSGFLIGDSPKALKFLNLPNWVVLILIQNLNFFRLSAMTRTLPQFYIKWKSRVVQTNTRMSILTPEAASQAHCRVPHIVLISFYFVFRFCIFVNFWFCND